MNNYIKLAKDTINEYVLNKRVLDVPKDLPKEMLNKRAGVFVSIHIKPINKLTNQPFENTRGRPINSDGELRGCIGTILPTKSNITQEIINNAICACSQDYRFKPVNASELDNLEISVDVLGEPESINGLTNLDVKKYGVIVKTDDGPPRLGEAGRTGLLLPDLEGVDSPEIQVAIARQKAGIDPSESVYLYRFEVNRFK